MSLIDSNFPQQNKPVSASREHLAGDLINFPKKPANDNKNLQIPDDPSVMGRIEQQWNEMVKRNKQPTLTIVPKEDK